MTDKFSNNPVPERIAALRNLMRRENIAACIIPTADPHMSEYISDHFNIREYITGFTGSAGTAVITDSDAGLWTDSRYWLQAEQELAGSGIRLFKDGLADTPSVEEYLCEALSDGGLGAGDGAVEAPGAGAGAVEDPSTGDGSGANAATEGPGAGVGPGSGAGADSAGASGSALALLCSSEGCASSLASASFPAVSAGSSEAFFSPSACAAAACSA